MSFNILHFTIGRVPFLAECASGFEFNASMRLPPHGMYLPFKLPCEPEGSVIFRTLSLIVCLIIRIKSVFASNVLKQNDKEEVLTDASKQNSDIFHCVHIVDPCLLTAAAPLYTFPFPLYIIK